MTFVPRLIPGASVADRMVTVQVKIAVQPFTRATGNYFNRSLPWAV
jgi:hypothetical protein